MDMQDETAVSLSDEIHAAYSPEQVAELIDLMTHVREAGMQKGKIMTDGILLPDIFVLEGEVATLQFSAAMARIQQVPSLRRVEIVPFGIVQSDMWRLRAELAIKNALAG